MGVGALAGGSVGEGCWDPRSTERCHIHHETSSVVDDPGVMTALDMASHMTCTQSEVIRAISSEGIPYLPHGLSCNDRVGHGLAHDLCTVVKGGHHGGHHDREGRWFVMVQIMCGSCALCVCWR